MNANKQAIFKFFELITFKKCYVEFSQPKRTQNIQMLHFPSTIYFFKYIHII